MKIRYFEGFTSDAGFYRNIFLINLSAGHFHRKQDIRNQYRTGIVKVFPAKRIIKYLLAAAAVAALLIVSFFSGGKVGI